jgi:hypothetical protein
LKALPIEGAILSKDRAAPFLFVLQRGNMTDKQKFLGEMLERFHACKEHSDSLRQEALDDLKFINAEQWSEKAATERAEANRPMLTVNKAAGFVDSVVNEGLQNRPSVKVRPVDSLTDNVTAEVISGIIRHILNQGDSRSAIDTAYRYAVSCGFGYFRILTEFCDDNSFNQEIKVKQIQNTFSVYFPIHLITEPDYSDAPYCFIRQKKSKVEFKRRWPKQEKNLAEFEKGGTGDNDWVTEDGVYIAEYFDVEYETATLYLYMDAEGKEQTSEILPEGITAIKERTIQRRKVKWYLVTAFDILEENEWVGSTIPVIPMLGKELNVNGRIYYISLTRYMKEPQKMYNFWLTALTESIQSQPKAPYLVDAKSVEQHKPFWDTANTSTHPFLPFDTYDKETGKQLTPPQRISPPEPSLAIVQALTYAAQGMKETTGIYDAGLGAPGNERTGKAIVARQRQSNTATYHFINSENRAIRSLGKQLVEIIPKIIDTTRAVRILGEDMTDKVMTVNLLHPDENGNLYALDVGKYDVVSDVGPSYDTKNMEAVDMLTMLMQTAPETTIISADILARKMDFHGNTELSERFKRYIAQKYPGIIPDEEMGAPEAQLRSQLQQITLDMEKMLQKSATDDAQKVQMMDMIKSMDAVIKNKDAEVEAKIETANIRAQAEIARAQMQYSTEQMKQEHDTKMKAMDMAMKLHSSGSGNAETQGE